MSPKGGIKPHNRFSVQAKRSEVLFVDYMAEHLTPTGRAGIIVPEGVIFQSQTAYTQLRKMLVGQYLVAVVSLPAGCSTLFRRQDFDPDPRQVARQENRHHRLLQIRTTVSASVPSGARLNENDLPQAEPRSANTCAACGPGNRYATSEPTLGHIVAKEKIAANGDYNLSGERYRVGTGIGSFSAWPLVPVTNVFCKSEQSVLPGLLRDAVTIYRPRKPHTKYW